jgi:FKBP-type peptidyl-prolyl cis-trans isomerase
MKKIFGLITLIINSLYVSAQVQYIQLGATKSQFYLAVDATGNTAKIGQLVSMNMSIKDANGTFIKNTFKDPKPLMFPVKFPTFDGDIYEAVTMLSKGDSGMFLIPADSMYAKIFKQMMPAGLKKGSMLDVRIKVIDIFDQAERMEQLESKVDTSVSAQEKKRRLAEDAEIQKYIKTTGYDFQKTANGVYYSYAQFGKGEKAALKGNTAVINYTGKLLNGTQFESSYDEDGIGRPASFVIGKEQVIAGWDELLVGKREGDKLTCIVPSHLAFGNHNKGNSIPANSVLVFDIDVMGVR